jgi:hypothetical protein
MPRRSRITASIAASGCILLAVCRLAAAEVASNGKHTGEMKEAPTVWWRLLDRRNARWIPRIETAIRSGRATLIVAGALAFRLRRTSTLESSKIRENCWAYGVNV